MTLAIYTNRTRSSTHPRRRLVGTAHSGPAWTAAVGVLRSAMTMPPGFKPPRRSGGSREGPLARSRARAPAPNPLP